jgi:uncharacterized membrane protein YhaH (DUF805 family)
MSETSHRFGPVAGLMLRTGFVVIIAFLLLALAIGSYHFLTANLSRISVNADTLIPGIAAFVIATLAAHWMIAAYHRKRGRNWPFSNTCCLVAMLPVLFIIAFLVPGVILQLKLLFGEM